MTAWIGVPFLAFAVVSIAAANVPNLYSAGLNLLSLIFRRNPDSASGAQWQACAVALLTFAVLRAWRRQPAAAEPADVAV